MQAVSGQLLLGSTSFRYLCSEPSHFLTFHVVQVCTAIITECKEKYMHLATDEEIAANYELFASRRQISCVRLAV